MKISLVIMAAGLGSRFGQGIKQLEPIGLNNEIIMDYSIHDAIKTGFNKIVFIIRKDIEEEFNKAIGNRIKNICDRLGVEVCYAFQSLEDLPENVTLPNDRKKPWGTGQAILACKNLVNEPFVVINADDYYGKEAFENIYNFLKEYNTSKPYEYCMSGFILKNTLSKNGTVTRGICITDENDMLLRVQETKGIGYTEEGKLTCAQEEVMPILNEETVVSMNMWAAYPEFLDYLEKDFVNFLTKNGESKTSEYLLPMIVDELLQKGKAAVNVMRTYDKWIGITYAEDIKLAKESFKDMIKKGIYNADLWSK